MAKLREQLAKLGRKSAERMAILSVVYPIGIFLAGLLFAFKALNWVRIWHWEKFPTYRRNPNLYQNGLIVVSNHPHLLRCMFEVWLPVLFYRDYLRHPFKLRPFSVPDKTNFPDRWYWCWINPVAVPINRKGDAGEKRREIEKLIGILTSGGICVIFAEAGRTFKGTKFQRSAKGKRVRTLEGGVALLAQKTKAAILPIWVEDVNKALSADNLDPQKLYHRFPRFWEGVIVKIGDIIRFESLRFEGKPGREEIVRDLTNALLELADQELNQEE